jgi:hypothetical protein
VYGVLVLAGAFIPVSREPVQLAVIAFVIYLFYRLVLAVEQIAEQM